LSGIKIIARQEIDELLFDMLPDYMNNKQKKTKIHNVLYEMSNKKLKTSGREKNQNGF